jgi:hypothetical protein
VTSEITRQFFAKVRQFRAITSGREKNGAEAAQNRYPFASIFSFVQRRSLGESNRDRGRIAFWLRHSVLDQYLVRLAYRSERAPTRR